MIEKIGLDLGYANIVICDPDEEHLHREPSVALVDQKTHRVLKVGSETTLPDENEDAPSSESAILVRPFKNGLLYSSELTGEVLDRLMAKRRKSDRKLRCVVGIPAGFLPKQTAALVAMVRAAGADEVFAVERSLAALIGAGYSPLISAVSVNVGASRTEIMLTHEGKIIRSVSAEVGGEDFDRAVKKFIADQGDFNVSLFVASQIKETIGAVWEGKPSESIVIDGTLALTGSKVHMKIETEDILGVFREPLSALIGAVADVVKKIPTEIVSPVLENGVILTGGGAALYGMDRMLGHVLDLPVCCPKDPIDSVGKGLFLIGNFLPARMRADRDITASVAKFYRESKNK